MIELFAESAGFDDPAMCDATRLEPPSLEQGYPLSSGAFLEKLAAHWVEAYGGEGLKFTKEQENLLATHVQEGLALQASVAEDGIALTPEVTSKIKAGQRAEQALVEANLRFAFMYARESVGIDHPGVRARFVAAQHKMDAEQELSQKRSAGRPRTRQPWLGTYKPLGVMKSPYASLEDRYILGVVGLQKAAQKFKPNSKAKFISYAAWYVQSEIGRESLGEEHNGIRLPSHIAARVLAYFGDYPTVGPDHKVPEDIEQLLRVSEYRKLPEELPVQPAGIEALNDPWSEDDSPRTFGEVVDDPEDVLRFEVAHDLAKVAIGHVLQTLPEKEETVIRLRFGLADCACHTEVTFHTLDEIGGMIGLTRERIRQIESKILSKLRHPQRSKVLRGPFELLSEADSAPVGSLWRGDAIQLQQPKHTHEPDPDYPQDFSNVPPFMSAEEWELYSERQAWALRQKHKETWQIDADEPWDMSLREVARPATEDEVQAVAKILDTLPTFVFNKDFIDRAGSPYPVMALAQLREHLERTHLTGQQISSLWDGFMKQAYPRLKESLDDKFSADRVGELFSQLIVENINDNDDVVKLRIPDSASGEIGFLACRLGLGQVEITGSPGDHVAAWNHGYAVVSVNGDIGNFGGEMMNGSAILYVTGNAGLALGLGADGEAEISVNRARTVARYGEDVMLFERNPEP